MSRSHSIIGLTQAGNEFANALTEAFGEPVIYTTIDDVFGGTSICSLRRWTDSFDGSFYEESVQTEPWSSGPNSFLAIMHVGDSINDWIKSTIWSDEEIEHYL